MILQGELDPAPADGCARTGGDTRRKLLDAAERLFAERGIAAVSMRELTSSVNANVAAVHYHFGSKEKLIEEVYARGAKAITDERLRRLELARAVRDPDRRVEALVAAFLESGLFGGAALPGGVALFAKFRARLVIESSEFARSVIATCFNESSGRFLDAFREALPALSEADIEWRFHALLSVMVYTMANSGRIQKLTDGACEPTDVRAALDHLVPALAGMFRAPAGGSPAGNSKPSRVKKETKK